MSGKQEKRLRRAWGGVSIAERRDHHDFDRKIAAALEGRAERTLTSRNTRRAVFAWGALVAIVAAILAGLFL